MSYMQPAVHNGDRSVLALAASLCVCSEVVRVRKVSTTVGSKTRSCPCIEK